jgi:hypothetical protein
MSDLGEGLEYFPKVGGNCLSDGNLLQQFLDLFFFIELCWRLVQCTSLARASCFNDFRASASLLTKVTSMISTCFTRAKLV